MVKPGLWAQTLLGSDVFNVWVSHRYASISSAVNKDD